MGHHPHLRAAQSRAWQDAGLPALPVAVNVSGRQMHKPQEFLDHVSAALARAGLPGTRLEIELTESVVMQYPAQMIDVAGIVLRRIRVRIALDDFGTGHSSLSYLKRFPVDMLKIDGSFVRDLAIDGDDAAIARAIVSMGHALGLRVVAEGVEDEAQLNLLRQMGCDEAQGFLFSAPLPAHEMEACMRRSASRGAGTGSQSWCNTEIDLKHTEGFGKADLAVEHRPYRANSSSSLQSGFYSDLRGFGHTLRGSVGLSPTLE